MNPLKNILRWIKREKKETPKIEVREKRSVYTQKEINILHNKNAQARNKKKRNRTKNRVARKTRKT